MNSFLEKHTKLAELQKNCLSKQIPFVSYRLPLTDQIHSLVQYKSEPRTIDIKNEINTVKGFVISPFSDNANTILLEPDFQFENDNIPEELIEILTNNTIITNTDSLIPFGETTTQIEYEENVAAAVNEIKKGESISKIVISKTQLIDTPENFSAPKFFQLLCNKYPHAFVYMLQLPETGCWIGATPEPLLTGNAQALHTVSLAGTQAANNLPIDEYKWDSKEIEEQRIVTNFIEKTLTDAGISNYLKSETKNYQAANLIHLMSGFEFPISSDIKLSKLINALHPTPSVGGLPKKEAKEFILKHEKHNRKYYTGFLGIIDSEGESQLFVNLRCMQLFQKQALLFSGAGITSDSIPEKEWIETENKLQTLKQVLFSTEL